MCLIRLKLTWMHYNEFCLDFIKLLVGTYQIINELYYASGLSSNITYPFQEIKGSTQYKQRAHESTDAGRFTFYNERHGPSQGRIYRVWTDK